MVKKEGIAPEIKGSRVTKKKEYSSCYLTMTDKQVLFRLLTKRGMDSEVAKERIAELNRQQKKIYDQMKKKNKSDSEIKMKQAQMLEELWHYGEE